MSLNYFLLECKAGSFTYFSASPEAFFCFFQHVNIITVNSRLKISRQRFSPLSHPLPYKGFIYPMIAVSDVVLICGAKPSEGLVSGRDWQRCLMRALTPELKHWLEARTKINQDHLGMTGSARLSITIAVRWLVRWRIDLTAWWRPYVNIVGVQCAFPTQTWHQALLLTLIAATCERSCVRNFCSVKICFILVVGEINKRQDWCIVVSQLSCNIDLCLWFEIRRL